MTTTKLLALAGFALTLMAFDTPAAQPAATCTSAEHRQMDFWLGSWVARDKAGQLLGHQLIELNEQGCVLQEWWRGNGQANGAGTSLSMYDQKRKLWNHSWFSARGNLLSIEGNWNGKAMVMTGYYQNAEGIRELHRTQWQPLADGRVYQFWQSSLDGGLTWSSIHEAWMSRTTDPIAKSF